MGIKGKELLCNTCAKWDECEFNKINLGDLIDKNDLETFMKLIEEKYKYVKDYVFIVANDSLCLSAVDCEKWKW